MANIIQIKRSGSTATPSNSALAPGELAYSAVSENLFIGGLTGGTTIKIGGDSAVRKTDEVVTSLGNLVSASGIFDGTTVNAALDNVTAASDIFGVLDQLDGAITDALSVGDIGISELSDVTITAAADEDFLVYSTSASAWIDQTPAQVKATLDLEIGTDVQAFDATLTSIAALGTAAGKMAYTTALDTWAETDITGYARTLLDDGTSSAARTTLDVYSTSEVDGLVNAQDTLAEMTDVDFTALADGQFMKYVSGSSVWKNATFELADVSDITASAAELNILDGVIATTAELNILDGVTASAAEINVLDGISATLTAAELSILDGVTASAIEINLLDGVTSSTSELNILTGVTTDATELNYVDGVTSAIQTQLDSMVEKGGDTMDSGVHLLFSGTGEVRGLPATPSLATSATSKAYVDALISGGSSWRNPVTDADLVDIITANPASPEADYGLSAGDNVAFVVTSGTFTASLGTGTTVVGAAAGDVLNLTITSTGNGDYKLIDTPIAAGDRFIIGAEHGLIGSALGLLEPNEDGFGLEKGDLIQFVTGTGATETDWSTPEGRVGTSSGTPEIPQGTTVLNSDPDSVHYGHTYLYNAQDNAWVEIAGPGSIQAGIGLGYSGNVLDVNLGAGIKELPSDEVGLDIYTVGALLLTEDGTTASTGTDAGLYLQLDGGTLAQSGSGLKIPADGVTATEINANVAGDGLGQAAGGALEVNVDDSSIETNADAIRVKASGVTNTMLANPGITMAGDSGSDSVDLGETFTFTGGEGIDTAITANVVTITGEDATITNKGIASFNTSHFSVTSGAVSLAATAGDLTNMAATVDSASDGEALSFNASSGNFEAGYSIDGGTF